MEIKRYETPLLKSNMYLIHENGRGILLDPYDDLSTSDAIESMVERVDYIILTHEHYDHISGGNALRERYHCPLICGAACADRLPDPKRNFSRYFNAYVFLQASEEVPEELVPVQEYVTYADESFHGTKEILWQGHQIELTETPGHSPGSICILLDRKFLFSGDTLLPGGKQLTRFPDGSRSQYEQYALPYFRSLPRDILVYPGHYDSFRLNEYTND